MSFKIHAVAAVNLAKLSAFIFMIGLGAALLTPSTASANPKYAAFVYDANAGKILFSRNADSYRFPASLTKVMTLYMVFDAIDAGKITLDTRMKVSKHAASQPPSKLYLKVGSTIKVRDAILALVTKSANDVAAVIAEHLGGTEAKFARAMTRKARRIGMKKTTFKNASGLPNREQRTTARDMARLGLSIRKAHPKSFAYFNRRTFKYGKVTYRNHNRLLGRVKGVNGIKTGYIRASGFNLLSNVESGGRHVVAVVMGGKTGRSRNAHMTTLINRHFKKASRKESLVKKTPLLVANNFATDKAPIPRLNPRITSVQTADVIPQPGAAPISKKSTAPIVIAANTGLNQPVEQGSQEDKPNIIKPKAVTVAKIVVDPNGERKIVSDTTTSSTQTTRQTPGEIDGWKIQISATPTLEGAEKLLAEAAEKGASVLSTKVPYTEPVNAGGTTLYRVRFAGFDDKNTARRACDYMKRKRYKCIALN